MRQYGDAWVLTHKRRPDDEDTASIYKVRIETESKVEDGRALAEIFTRLGYGPAFRYEKYRTEYTHGGGHLVLDETPIGVFAELEGPTDWIDRSAGGAGGGPGKLPDGELWEAVSGVEETRRGARRRILRLMRCRWERQLVVGSC